MKIRSIRVTLLFWYAVLLLGSMGVLGTVLHQQMRSLLYRQTDAWLGDRLDVLRRAIERERNTRDSTQLAQVVRAALPSGSPFAAFDRDGRLYLASTENAAPSTPPTMTGSFTRDDHRWRVEQLSDARGWLVVGHSVRDENHGIRTFLFVLLATGAGIVLLALAGGYVLVSKALAPAHQIARTARRISASNLGERIPPDRVPTELREVALALNQSFAGLEQAFAAQIAFTADASHELRTPLAILRSHLELARSTDDITQPLRDRLAICHDAALRLQGIIAALLTLARADSGDLPFEEGDVDLGRVAESEVEAMAPLAQSRGITIACQAAPVLVRGDRARLRDILCNLIDNAIRYNHDGGGVDVTVSPEDGAAVLRVADTGIGIAEEHRQRIFERFVRVDMARSRSQGGSGLGLAIVRYIVERHGGSIIAGERSGGGAEFVVRLPLARSSTTPAPGVAH